MEADHILRPHGLIPRVASSDELNATVVIEAKPAFQSGPGASGLEKAPTRCAHHR